MLLPEIVGWNPLMDDDDFGVWVPTGSNRTVTRSKAPSCGPARHE
jgi:hypothetical protein